MIVQEDDGGGTAEGLLWITNHPRVEKSNVAGHYNHTNKLLQLLQLSHRQGRHFN